MRIGSMYMLVLCYYRNSARVGNFDARTSLKCFALCLHECHMASCDFRARTKLVELYRATVVTYAVVRNYSNRGRALECWCLICLILGARIILYSRHHTSPVSISYRLRKTKLSYV